MFPTTAPANGPGSSFLLNQDRWGLYQSIHDVSLGLLTAGAIFDPNSTSLLVPQLGGTMQLGLPSGRCLLGGSVGRVGSMSITLPPFSDTYVDLVPYGLGAVHDLPEEGEVLYQSAGAHQGSWRLTVPFLTATASIDHSGHALIRQQYSGQLSAAVGVGVGIVDRAGTGYAAYLGPSGGGFYRLVNRAISGNILLPLVFSTTYAVNTEHTIILDTQYLGGTTYELTLHIDSLDIAILYQDTQSPLQAPDGLFPVFLSDGSSVYLDSWGWSAPHGPPLLGWYKRSVLGGGTPPPLVAGSTRFYRVSTSTIPVATQNLFDLSTVPTRIAALRQSLAQLQQAYL